MITEHAHEFDLLVRYYARDLPPDEETAIEDHWARCPTCADAAADVATLVAGVTDLAARGFALWAISPPLLERFRERGLRIHEGQADPGGTLAIEHTADIDLLIGRLRGDFSGLRQVDVVFDTQGQAMAEHNVPVHSGREVIIACVLHLHEPAGSKVRTLCTIKADGVVLGEYQLSIDVS